jgi:hypothetical protein
MRELEATNRKLWEDLEAIEASASWRLTEPLRGAKARGERIRRRLRGSRSSISD